VKFSAVFYFDILHNDYIIGGSVVFRDVFRDGGETVAFAVNCLYIRDRDSDAQQTERRHGQQKERELRQALKG
jgi:hypothetical protein